MDTLSVGECGSAEGSFLRSSRGKWAEKEPNWIQVVSWQTWESILFNQIRNKSRLSGLFYQLFCQILLWCEVSQPAWINISAASSRRKCQNCWIFTISGPAVWENRDMCAHCVDKNTELLEVGSLSVRQGRRPVLRLQKVKYRVNENEAVMFGLLLTAQQKGKVPSLIMKTYFHLNDYRSNEMQVKSRIAWTWPWIALKCC